MFKDNISEDFFIDRQKKLLDLSIKFKTEADYFDKLYDIPDNISFKEICSICKQSNLFEFNYHIWFNNTIDTMYKRLFNIVYVFSNTQEKNIFDIPSYFLNDFTKDSILPSEWFFDLENSSAISFYFKNKIAKIVSKKKNITVEDVAIIYDEVKKCKSFDEESLFFRFILLRDTITKYNFINYLDIGKISSFRNEYINVLENIKIENYTLDKLHYLQHIEKNGNSVFYKRNSEDMTRRKIFLTIHFLKALVYDKINNNVYFDWKDFPHKNVKYKKDILYNVKNFFKKDIVENMIFDLKLEVLYNFKYNEQLQHNIYIQNKKYNIYTIFYLLEKGLYLCDLGFLSNVIHNIENITFFEKNIFTQMDNFFEQKIEKKIKKEINQKIIENLPCDIKNFLNKYQH